jgi:hypothetical protein
LWLLEIRFFEANKKLNPLPIVIGNTLVYEEFNFEVERRKSNLYKSLQIEKNDYSNRSSRFYR